MKISQLPEHVKIKPLKYQKNAGIVWDKTTDRLAFAFDWEDLEEGNDYWKHWDDKDFITATSSGNKFVGPLAGKTIIEDQTWKVTTTDTIVLSVIEDLNSRSILGIEKYKTTLDREDLSRKDWLQHAYEECLDQANYLKKLISLEK